jgi:4-hydroxybenzoate polyprenyltransferase
MLFFPGWSTMLAGYLIHTKERWIYFVYLGTDIWILLFSFAILMGGAFIFNQLCDVESDRQNRKLFLISDGLISRRVAIVEAITLSLVALTIGLVFDLFVGMVYGIFFLVTALLYNYRPAILKDRPWGSLLANAVMGGLAFCAGWAAQYQFNTNLIFDLLPYLLFNTALYLHTTLPDIEGDRGMQKRTLAVIYGPDMIIRAAFMIYMTGFFVAWMANDYLALFFFICSAPFFVYTVISHNILAAVQTTKYGILFFAVAICLRWPPYFILMLSGFVLTKLYYKMRFNFNYPQLS